MSKYEAGKTVNHFFIKETEKRKNKTYCLVICPACQKEKWIRSDSLLVNKDCGCRTQFKCKNLAGKQFGRLTAVKLAYIKNNRSFWICSCDCGNSTIVQGKHLTDGSTKSCGCYKKEKQPLTSKKVAKIFKEEYLKEGTNIAFISSDKPLSTNKSGVKGVSFDKNRNKWKAQLIFQGELKLSKRFDTFEEAVQARREAEEMYFNPIITKYKSGDQNA